MMRLPYLSDKDPHTGAIMAAVRAATEKAAPDQNAALVAVPRSEIRIGRKDAIMMSPAWIRAQPIHKASKLRR
jgi:hypothetical protein